MHKKIKILGFFCLAFFLFKIDVQASEGALCTYEISSSVRIVCSVSEEKSLSCSVAMVQSSGAEAIVSQINTNKLSTSTFQKEDKWNCPSTLYGTYNSSNFTVTNLTANSTSSTTFKLLEEKSSYGSEIQKSSTGNPSGSSSSNPSGSSSSNPSGSSSTGSSSTREKTTGCAILGGVDGKTVQLLSQVVKFIRLGVPILIIILGITDFMRILFSGEEKVFKEAFSKFIKRLLIGVIIIFLPYILQLLVSLSGIETQYGIDNFFCGIIDATGVKSDSVDKYKTRADCEARGYTWQAESTSPNGGFCSKTATNPGKYATKTQCEAKGYTWVEDISKANGGYCMEKKASASSFKTKKTCEANSYTWIPDSTNSNGGFCANTKMDAENYTTKEDCELNGHTWRGGESTNPNGGVCVEKKAASSYVTKQECELNGYTWQPESTSKSGGICIS